jgi:hypothetical protein
MCVQVILAGNGRRASMLDVIVLIAIAAAFAGAAAYAFLCERL